MINSVSWTKDITKFGTEIEFGKRVWQKSLGLGVLLLTPGTFTLSKNSKTKLPKFLRSHRKRIKFKHEKKTCLESQAFSNFNSNLKSSGPLTCRKLYFSSLDEW